MKKASVKASVLIGMGMLLALGSGCVVRHHPAPVVSVRPARVHVRPARVHVRPVRVRPVRRCAYNKCRTRCNIWGCHERCRRVYRRCY